MKYNLRSKTLALYLVSSIFCLTSGAYSQSIVNTVHNLSVSGPGKVKASSESEICIFCHTPHNSAPQQPLWNKNISGVSYTLYTSSTEQAVSGQPDGSSILCLSCHDGTIALGNVISRTTPISFSSGITTLPSGKTNLSTDLSDDHPISFIYDAALSTSDGQLVNPSGILAPVVLENSKVQCTSCHDAHKNTYNKFLVASNQNSDLCMYCHQMTYWANTTHNSSTKTWSGTGTSPWLHTSNTTVSQNACENCHNPHNAGGKYRLRNYQAEENNCLYCHNGNVAAKNIETQLSKAYKHNVYNYIGIHDPKENTVADKLHDECEDCHNPHASNSTTASAPYANGFLAGVKGIDLLGNPVNPIQYQYELCFRCHANSTNKPGSAITRQIVQNNVLIEFDLLNPSYHPIEGPGANPNVPSLISTYTSSSIIYCTDCHASDGSGAPKGPHGSIFPQIMKLQNTTTDYTSESATTYALCYSCHSRSALLNESPPNPAITFRYHKLHVVDQRTPCSTCHDPHGISKTQGNVTNNSKLINFNTSIVSASGANLKFVDGASGSRYCLLRCHGETHASDKHF